MQTIKNIVSWVVLSSVNSDKISLTLKAGIPFLVLLGVSDTDTLNNLVGSLGATIANLTQLISGCVTVFGLLRKIWYSLPTDQYED